MQNFNLNYILKMGTPPTKFWGTYSQCTKSKEDTPPHSFIMADRGRKRFTAGQVLEAIFTDQDSDNENYDCGSDTESIVNDENNSASEESDLDDSITLPNETSSQTIESVSGALKGNFYS